jgi:septal ring factor EnvC (AmiA/AmiB activator)
MFGIRLYIRHKFDDLESWLNWRLNNMTDQLDTVIARVEEQTSVIGSIGVALDSFLATNADLRGQVAALTEQLGEAADDNDQIATINATLDASDASLNELKTKLAPAVVVNTPAEDVPVDSGEDSQTGKDTNNG